MCVSIPTIDGLSELRERSIHLHVTDGCVSVCCGFPITGFILGFENQGDSFRIARTLLRF